MSKFKKGDLVKVIADKTPEQAGAHLVGLIGVVTHVGPSGPFRYEVERPNGRLVLASAAELELHRPKLLNEQPESRSSGPATRVPVVSTGSKKGVAHYAAGMPEGIEPMDIIRTQGWAKHFAYGNALKYLCRAPHKGTELIDINKAIDYLKEVADIIEQEAK